MSLVAGLDVGGSSVKAWVVGDGVLLAEATAATTTLRPAPDRAELDPSAWEAAARRALTEAVGQVPGEYDGVTVSSLRQGFVLLGRDGEPLGPGVLNSDGRGASHAQVLAGRHGLTGHWPAAELTLPKLLHLRDAEPERWAATARVLFVHDWLVQRLCGAQVTEASYACAGGMADVVARDWAHDLLDDVGLGSDRLAPVVEAGTPVGALRPGWGLPGGVPVVAGCGDTQLAAAGVGGLADGVVTVVAGSSTPVQAASAQPLLDPRGHGWVSTHAARDRWAVEGNAGYPGTYQGWWQGLAPGDPAEGPGDLLAVTGVPEWSEAAWLRRGPVSLVGLQPDTTRADVARALLEAHAYAVRGNVEDLERVVGRPACAVVVCGGAVRDGALPRLLATVLGRELHWAHGASAAALAGAALVSGRRPGLPQRTVPAGDPAPYDAPYARWRAAVEGLRTS